MHVLVASLSWNGFFPADIGTAFELCVHVIVTIDVNLDIYPGAIN